MTSEITLRYDDGDRTWRFTVDGACFAEASTEDLGHAILMVARERPAERITIEARGA
jgi:hypothetical protein